MTRKRRWLNVTVVWLQSERLTKSQVLETSTYPVRPSGGHLAGWLDRLRSAGYTKNGAPNSLRSSAEEQRSLYRTRGIVYIPPIIVTNT